MSILVDTINDIEIEELDVWRYLNSYLVDVLNGKKDIAELKEDLLSFRNSKYYTGTQEKYKETPDDQDA